ASCISYSPPPYASSWETTYQCSEYAEAVNVPTNWYTFALPYQTNCDSNGSFVIDTRLHCPADFVQTCVAGAEQICTYVNSVPDMINTTWNAALVAYNNIAPNLDTASCAFWVPVGFIIA